MFCFWCTKYWSGTTSVEECTTENYLSSNEWECNEQDFFHEPPTSS